MTALEEILSDVKTSKAEGAERFEALARAIYADEKPTTAEVLDILRAAGKTTDDLSRRVSLFQQRDAIRARSAERVRIAAREVELRAEVQAANQSLERHVAEHQQTCHPLQYELRSIQDWRVANNGSDAHELLKLCACPKLLDAHATAQTWLSVAERKHADIRKRLELTKRNVGGNDYQRFASTRQQIDDRVKRIEAELEAASDECSRRQRELNEVETLMREW